MKSLFSAALLFWAALCAHPEPRIILLDHQVVDGERIQLGEVALLENWPAEEEQLLDQLDLGRAPGPGRIQVLKSVFVRAHVFKALGRTEGFQFIAEPLHRVLGEGEVIGAERLIEEARRFVLAETGWGPDEMTLTPARPPQDLFLPRGDYQLAVRRLSSDYYGTTLLKVSALEQGVEKGHRTVQFNIARTTPALVAARALPAGHALSSADVLLRPVELPTPAYEARLLASPGQVEGLKTRGVIAAGQPVLLDGLESPMLVRRGDSVDVWVKSGEVTIKTRGEAGRNGRRGERIPVLANGRSVWGEVVGASLVLAEIR